MSERMPPNGWESWQAEWRRARSADTVAQGAPRYLARARLRLLSARLIESAVAAGAILITAAALRHAGPAGTATETAVAALGPQRREPVLDDRRAE